MRISYAKFLQLLEMDRVKRVVVYGDMKTAIVEVRICCIYRPVFLLILGRTCEAMLFSATEPDAQLACFWFYIEAGSLPGMAVMIRCMMMQL
jgi:hypothetical protein